MIVNELFLLPFGVFLNAIIKIASALTIFISLLWFFDRKRIIEIYTLFLTQLKKRNEH